MTRDQLQACTKKQLIEMARDQGIVGWHGMRKDELLHALQEKPARAISPKLRVRRVCLREAVAEGVVLAGEIGTDPVCQRPFLEEGEDEEPGTAN